MACDILRGINLIFFTKYLHDTYITWSHVFTRDAWYNTSTRTISYSCVAIESNILAILKISASVVFDNSANFATITRSSEAFVSKHKKKVAQYTIAALRKSIFDFNDISFLAFLATCFAFRTPLCT